MRLAPLILLALAGALPAHAAAAAAEAARLTVTFTGLEPRGRVSFVLVDSAQAYDDKAAPIAADRLAVTGPSAAKTLEGLSPGRYAIKAFHDVDGDDRLATNPFGMPTEPFGFSNNARAAMGPPKWDEAAFEVRPGANQQTIDLD